MRFARTLPSRCINFKPDQNPTERLLFTVHRSPLKGFRKAICLAESSEPSGIFRNFKKRDSADPKGWRYIPQQWSGFWRNRTDNRLLDSKSLKPERKPILTPIEFFPSGTPVLLAADSRRHARTFCLGDPPPRYAMADRNRPGKNMHASRHIFLILSQSRCEHGRPIHN